jgi:hypothetical protein
MKKLAMILMSRMQALIEKARRCNCCYEKGAKKSRDKQITEWANSTLVALRRDLSAAQRLFIQFDKN